jgi:hypothetical protein
MSVRIPTIPEVHDSKFSLSGGLEVLTSIASGGLDVLGSIALKDK